MPITHEAESTTLYAVFSPVSDPQYMYSIQKAKTPCPKGM
jgi:hypothetical protein